MLKSGTRQYRAGLVALSAAVVMSDLAAKWHEYHGAPPMAEAAFVAPCDEGLAGHMANSLSYTMNQRFDSLLDAALEAGYANDHASLKHEGELSVRYTQARRESCGRTGMCNFGSDAQVGFRFKPIVCDGNVTGMRIQMNPAHPLFVLGFRSGDILRAVNGKPANRPGALSSLVGAIRAGGESHFLIERNGKLHCLRVVVE